MRLPQTVENLVFLPLTRESEFTFQTDTGSASLERALPVSVDERLFTCRKKETVEFKNDLAVFGLGIGFFCFLQNPIFEFDLLGGSQHL